MAVLSMRTLSLLLASLLQAAAASSDSHCKPGSEQGQCEARAPKKPDNLLLQTKTTSSSHIQKHFAYDDSFVDLKDITFPVMFNGESETQKADIMHPTGSAPSDGWPAMILVHGLGHTKSQMYGHAKKFMKLSPGRLTLCPNFVYGDRRFVDIRASIEFLASDSVYNVNPGKITLFGYSFGGTIATELILTDTWVYETLQAAIVVAGTYGHQQWLAHDHFPPLLLVHCENDNTMKSKHSNNLYNALAALGQPTDLQIEGCSFGHNPMKDDAWFFPLVDGFIKKQPAKGTTITTSTSSSQCKSWCLRNTNPIEVKATWPDCGGCQAATTTTTTIATTVSSSQCKTWCSRNPQPIEVKVTWPDCSGCQCLPWCERNAAPFEVKVGWPDCNGCTE
jgi:predicted esterase